MRVELQRNSLKGFDDLFAFRGEIVLRRDLSLEGVTMLTVQSVLGLERSDN